MAAASARPVFQPFAGGLPFQAPRSPGSRLLKNSFLTEKYANIPMNLRVNFQIHGFFIILVAGGGFKLADLGIPPLARPVAACDHFRFRTLVVIETRDRGFDVEFRHGQRVSATPPGGRIFVALNPAAAARIPSGFEFIRNEESRNAGAKPVHGFMGSLSKPSCACLIPA